MKSNSEIKFPLRMTVGVAALTIYAAALLPKVIEIAAEHSEHQALMNRKAKQERGVLMTLRREGIQGVFEE